MIHDARILLNFSVLGSCILYLGSIDGIQFRSDTEMSGEIRPIGDGFIIDFHDPAFQSREFLFQRRSEISIGDVIQILFQIPDGMLFHIFIDPYLFFAADHAVGFQTSHLPGFDGNSDFREMRPWQCHRYI